MSSHASLSFLVAVVAIFITVTAVSGTHIVSPSAKIAGHNANSLNIHKKVVGAGSRISNQVTMVKTPSNTITAGDSDMKIQCCDPHGTIADPQAHLLCKACNKMCYLGAMDARHDSHLLRKVCRCHAVAPCEHISFTMIKTLYGGANSSRNNGDANHAQNNDDNQDNVPVMYGTFVTSAGYQHTFLVLSIVSFFSMMITAFIYYFFESREHSRNTKNLTMSIALSTYIALIAETIKKPTVTDFRSTGVKIPVKPHILTGLIPGLVNIIVYVYLFKYNKIQIPSVHPDLLSFYTKRISTRNQMFKISILMFIVDFVYILDITMEWDYTGIHILHLLKPSQGIMISYVLLFRPFVPVLYNKLLKSLRRRKRSANEETANPIYTITTV